MVDDEAPRTPEETRDFIRETLQNAVGDMGQVIDTSTPAGCLAFARSIFPRSADRITAAEIVDEELRIRVTAPFEYITVNFTAPFKEGPATMQAPKIAHVVHEANRAVQIIQADPTISVSKHWEDLDSEMRASAIDGVHGVLAGNTLEQSHENWCHFKRENGWTLGPVKDETKKEHPLLVPYDELPESQQVKDHLFVAIVNVLKDA